MWRRCYLNYKYINYTIFKMKILGIPVICFYKKRYSKSCYIIPDMLINNDSVKITEVVET